MEHEGTLHSFEVMENTNLTTMQHIQDALNPQQHHCGNLKSCKLHVIWLVHTNI